MSSLLDSDDKPVFRDADIGNDDAHSDEYEITEAENDSGN